MKGLLLCLIFLWVCMGKVQSQNPLLKCLGIDTNFKEVRTVKFNGTLVGMEMLPQGGTDIKELERRKLTPRYHGYYAIQVKLDSCNTTEWFTCGDTHFELPEEFETSVKVRLSGKFYGNVNNGDELSIIINHVIINHVIAQKGTAH